MTPEKRALVVDDEPDICDLLAITLTSMGIETDTATSLRVAKERLAVTRYDLCLTDMRLPDGDGLELVEHIQDFYAGVPVAVITAHGSVETAVQALKLGAFDFLSKPLDLNNLRNIVSTALRLDREVRGKTEGLIGESPAILAVRDLVERVARSQAPVHIRGESGTGKELVARMIHSASARREAAFVPVNCGAIPHELMESEFFGHVKGSFTGATSDKIGLFRAAEGGTLFLDEIAELPLSMQVKLLRVIQEKKVRPVGAAAEISVDARILSATHQNLSALVAEGKFREDLFYRINVIELPVPPLRERGDDVFLLSHALLARHAERLGAEPLELTDDAKAALKAHAFPGNVRELENILERAVTLCRGKRIEAADLQIDHDAYKPPPRAASSTEASPTPRVESGPLTPQLEDVERQAIVEALEKTRYNKTAAAKLLGLTFRQLRYRVKKLGIE